MQNHGILAKNMAKQSILAKLQHLTKIMVSMISAFFLLSLTTVLELILMSHQK